MNFESNRSAFVPKKMEEKIIVEKFPEQLGKLENNQDEVRLYRLLLNSVSKGQIKDSQVLKSFVKPRFNSSGYLLKSDTSDYERINGNVVDKDAVGTGISIEDQKKLIEELVGFLENTSISDELKENLRRYLTNPDDSSFDRMQAVMMVVKEAEVKDSINNCVRNLSKEQARLALENEFFKKIKDKKPLKELLDFLGSYEEKDDKDRALVTKLQTRAVNENRLVSVSATMDNFNNSNYDETLDKLATLGTSPLVADREAAKTLAKALYAVELAAYREKVTKNISASVIPQQLRELLTSLPERAPIDDLDHVKTYAQMRDKVEVQLAELIKIDRLDKANKIRESFKNSTPEKILQSIEELPKETQEDLSVKEELILLYRTFTANERPDIFDKQFGNEILLSIQTQQREKFISPELGKNKLALDHIRKNFVKNIFPLIESFRTDPTTKKEVEEFLGTKNGERMRTRYEIRLAKLAEQRVLTDIERAYLESVELLSLFNPYLVAATYTEQGVTSEFLRHHFDTLSKNTIENLKDGDYIPLIQIGTGPNGLASVGEVVRNNPELAAQMLVIDSGDQPGGPFAIPGGRAWELNSANRRGLGGATLPENPENGNVSEIETVRSYGSPLRWYPGERKDGETVRGGSINTTVDYLPTPDDLSSTSRYPTNEDLQLVLALQSSVLINNLALQTKVISVKPNPDKNAKGDKLVTLQINKPGEETKTITVAADALFVAAGLGEPTYGFRLEGTNAERIIESTKGQKGFPKISTTLEAFKALASRTEEQESPGETIVLWGKGNSADTLIEFIGNTFQGDNPKVRNVTKIYVVAEGDLSSRPRYAAIADLKPRNGKGNLIEFVKARVQDVTFESLSEQENVMDRKVKLVNEKGQFITDGSGKEIIADSAIAATGFKSQLDSVLESYLESGQSFKNKTGDTSPTELLKLPTNENVSVAETLKSDPTIMFLGTASNPDFKNEEKLLQLPEDARKALQRNGAENAVAIGFRAPDTQAAVNIWLNTKEITLNSVETNKRSEVALDGDFKNGDSTWIPIKVTQDFKIPDNVTNENLIMTPLFSYSVGNSIEVKNSEGKGFTGELNFEVDYDPSSWQIELVFNGGSSESISDDIKEAVKSACSDYDFQRYAINALQKKRRNRKIDIALAFTNGKLNPQNTFVQI